VIRQLAVDDPLPRPQPRRPSQRSRLDEGTHAVTRVFVDESCRTSYLLVATHLQPAELDAARADPASGVSTSTKKLTGAEKRSVRCSPRSPAATGHAGSNP
jgi:hypothetical protein